MATTLSPSETKALTHKINTELTTVNKTFQSAIPLKDITAILVAHDLDPKNIQNHLHGNEGRLHVQIGPEIWFTMSWTRMGTGRFEINAYATSMHDDHRDPYTKVMDGSERRKAKDQLNKLLEPVNKTYYRGKGQAFAAIQDAISKSGFNWHEFEDSTSRTSSDSGRLNVDIGNKFFLTVTWYKMDSGRYEIVAYAS